MQHTRLLPPVHLSLAIAMGLCFAPMRQALSQTVCHPDMTAHLCVTDTGELSGSPGSNGGDYGRAIAMDGGYMAVGDPNGMNVAGTTTGLVYVYQDVGGSWQPVQTLEGVGDGDGFGFSLDLQGNRMIVSAWHQSIVGVGAVYIYELVGSSWQLQHELPLPQGVDRAHKVAIDHDRAVVTYTDYPGGNRAHVYEYQNGAWQHTATLWPSLSGAVAFGASLALQGDTIAIGDHSARGSDGAEYVGSVMVYSYAQGAWSPGTRLEPASFSLQGGDIYGVSVSLSGNWLAVGAPGTNPGSAVVFQKDEALQEWTEFAVLHDVYSTGDTLGNSVAFDGALLLVGDGDDRLAHVFSYVSGQWTQLVSIPNPQFKGWEAGEAVAMKDGKLAVTDPHVINPGRVYTYELYSGSSIAQGPVVFRPDTQQGSGTFFFAEVYASGTADHSTGYGAATGHIPLLGDWDGDGFDTVGIYDTSTSTFHLRNNNHQGGADLIFQYGDAAAGANYVPLAGDWDGDGVTTIGLFDTTSSTFLLRNSNGPGYADISFSYGASGDRPVVGDWDGDGRDTVGIMRDDGGVFTFHLKNQNQGGYADITLSLLEATPLPAASQPVAGDLDGDGDDEIGVYHEGVFRMRTDLTASGPASWVVAFGAPTDTAGLFGDWQ